VTTGSSLRLGLTTWSADTDPFTREQMMDTVDALEENACKFIQGVAASLPEASAEYENSFYLTTDTSPKLLYFCDGSDWHHVVETDNSTTERSSTGVIRVKDGGITLAKLASELTNSTGIFVRRNGASDAMTGPLKLQDVDPTQTYHAARKSYVDGPYVYYTDGVAQTFTSNVYGNVRFQTKVADTGSPDDFTSSTGVFTVPRSGAYLVSSTIKAEGDSAVYFRFRIRRWDGATERIFEGPRFRANNITGVSTEAAILCFSHAVRADEGDQISIQCAPSTGGTYTLGQELTITWLHGAPATFTG
jgi:hypothetical protein